jgi:hypothetical protein
MPCRPVALAAGLVVLMALPVAAQDGPGAVDSGWSYTVAPYVFAAGMQGTAVTLPGPPPADVDAGFSDLFDHLRFAGMVTGAASNGRWGLSGDFQYYNLAPAFDTPGPAFDGGKLTARQTILSLQGDYVLAESDRARLIGFAGARWWSVDTTLQFNAGALPGQRIEGSDSWIDPVVGLRGRYDLSDRVFLTGWSAVGGFGVGSDSMGDLFGAVGYRFGERSSGVVGYRWMSIDRDTDDFMYDMTMDGIMAGVTFGF